MNGEEFRQSHGFAVSVDRPETGGDWHCECKSITATICGSHETIARFASVWNESLPRSIECSNGIHQRVTQGPEIDQPSEIRGCPTIAQANPIMAPSQTLENLPNLFKIVLHSFLMTTLRFFIDISFTE
jgi:hypothetical protein